MLSTTLSRTSVLGNVKAEVKYGIPKSSINDYTTGRVEIGK